MDEAIDVWRGSSDRQVVMTMRISFLNYFPGSISSLSFRAPLREAALPWMTRNKTDHYVRLQSVDPGWKCRCESRSGESHRETLEQDAHSG